MVETVITTHKHNHLIDPYLQIWGWEVPLYLFLGGLAAGILITTAVAHLSKKPYLKTAQNKLILWGPVLLSIGMLFLFLDLENKKNIFRFYMTFQITSPMSWGAWILILYYPISILMSLSRLHLGYPKLFAVVEKIPLMNKLIIRSEKVYTFLAYISLPTGISLGVYTGVLLSAYVARPFWNSSLLGLFFSVSGLSSALALAILMTKDREERKVFTRFDLLALCLEIIMIILFVIGLSTDSQHKLDALQLITGGPYTLYFWLWFVSLGVVLPTLLEYYELRGKFHVPVFLPPVFVLVGGLVFRFVMVELGQISTWIPY